MIPSKVRSVRMKTRQTPCFIECKHFGRKTRGNDLNTCKALLAFTVRAKTLLNGQQLHDDGDETHLACHSLTATAESNFCCCIGTMGDYEPNCLVCLTSLFDPDHVLGVIAPCGHPIHESEYRCPVEKRPCSFSRPSSL